MPKSLRLYYLYEEILLLALRNEKGTFANGFPEYAIAGAVIAELLLDGHISISPDKKQLVELLNGQPVQDPIIDECLDKIKSTAKRASLKTWVSRLGRLKNLRHKSAEQLCQRKILRLDSDKILFLFTRKLYPELNPMPEKEVIERLRVAIFSDTAKVDPRTVVLISLAYASDLLQQNFGRKEIKSRRERIEQIIQGELTGKAAKDVIAACQAAIMVAAIMPAVMAGTH